MIDRGRIEHIERLVKFLLGQKAALESVLDQMTTTEIQEILQIVANMKAASMIEPAQLEAFDDFCATLTHRPNPS